MVSAALFNWRTSQQAAGEHPQDNSAKLTPFISVIQSGPEAASDFLSVSAMG